MEQLDGIVSDNGTIGVYACVCGASDLSQSSPSMKVDWISNNFDSIDVDGFMNMMKSL